MATAESEKTYSYQLRVRSLDPSQSVSNVVARINDLAPRMVGQLKEYGSKLEVSFHRVESDRGRGAPQDSPVGSSQCFDPCRRAARRSLQGIRDGGRAALLRRRLHPLPHALH
jgi:hypothetical protein